MRSGISGWEGAHRCVSAVGCVEVLGGLVVVVVAADTVLGPVPTVSTPALQQKSENQTIAALGFLFSPTGG